MQHPAFDVKTPYRVRALIGAFTQANPLHFHAENGQGLSVPCRSSDCFK